MNSALVSQKQLQALARHLQEKHGMSRQDTLYYSRELPPGGLIGTHEFFHEKRKVSHDHR